MPYGFMEQFQALLWNRVKYRENMRALLSAMFDRLGVSTESIVKAFEKCDSFDDAGIGIGLILEREDLTDDHVNRIANAWLKNDQVSESSSAREGMREFFDRYRNRINGARLAYSIGRAFP